MPGGTCTSAAVSAGADDDTLLQEELLRLFQEIGLDAFPLGMRPHIARNTGCHSSRVGITRLNTDSNQLRKGLFLIYDYCGKMIHGCTFWIQVSGRAFSQLAKTQGNDVSVEIEIASRGVH